MKSTVRTLILVVLTTWLILDHCIDCNLNGKRNIVKQELETKTSKRDEEPKQLCGRRKISLGPIKREINGLSNVYDSSEDYTYDDPEVDKILGGSYTTYGEFPWMATIMYYNHHLCGGAILNEFWIISVAHCFVGIANETLRIAVGDHRLLYSDAKEVIFEPKTVIVHEQFGTNPNAYDIALVKIKPKSNGRGIQFNDYVQPVCLASSREPITLDTNLLFSGWGYTSTANMKPWVLKKASLPLFVIPIFCQQSYRQYFTENSICAGYVRGDNDLCGGDSGGPAVINQNGVFVLFGIAVRSSGCRPPNLPAIFSSVPRFRSWIDGTINQHSSDSEKIMPPRN